MLRALRTATASAKNVIALIDPTGTVDPLPTYTTGDTNAAGDRALARGSVQIARVAIASAPAAFDPPNWIPVSWLTGTGYERSRTVTTVTTTSGSPNITAPGSAGANSFLAKDVAAPVVGTGIPAGAPITGFTSAGAATLSANATASGTVSLTVSNLRGDGNRDLLVSDDSQHPSSIGALRMRYRYISAIRGALVEFAGG